MNKIWLLLLVVVLLVAAGAAYWIWWLKPGTAPEPIVTLRSITVPLLSQNNSGQDGQATLTETNGTLLVEISLTNAPQGTPQPAHIHLGACPNPGTVQYPLTSLVNGSSKTELTVKLDDLQNQLPLAVNVHKSGAEAGVYVACGDVNF